jgi:tRNA (guanosine-2'-O-)-methyltransferase
MTVMEDFDISKPSALFLNERDGLSEEMQRADGFQNSGWFYGGLNISVSAAIIIQDLTNRLRHSILTGICLKTKF